MKKLLIYLISILAFFIGGILLANFVIMPAFVQQRNVVSVPNVCNIPLDSALQVIKKNGLQGVVVERRPDQIIEEGKIIIQDPLPDTKVKKGRIINLTVSMGIERTKVPVLYGIDYEKGRQILEKLGLIIEDIDSLYSDSVPLGRIIKTEPEFETEVKIGDRIKIFVSKGIMLKMPNLAGMKVAEAKEVLQKINLVIREITEIEGSGEKGTVIVQNPEPEKIVKPGDSVSLMIIK